MSGKIAGGKSEARAARLAEALRKNLKRRKGQAKTTSQPTGPQSKAPLAPGADAAIDSCPTK